MSLDSLIDQLPSGTDGKVKRACKRSRSALQEALRAECRLVMRLSVDSVATNQGVSVPVHVDPGYPEFMKDAPIHGRPDILRLLTRYRVVLEGFERLSPQLKKLLEDLSRTTSLDSDLQLEPSNLMNTQDWAGRLLAYLNKHNPAKSILQFDRKYRSDILGVYEYEFQREDALYMTPNGYHGMPHYPIEYEDNELAVNPAKIRLYWGVIGLISRCIGCSSEDLTIVVLAHELAHAYTQLGADIDGRRWPVLKFHDTDLYVVEGLAQYYTDRVLRRLSNRFGGALDAYKRLLKLQPDAYKVHMQWVEEHTPEAVRLAMLEVRRKGLKSLDDFCDCLKAAEKQLNPGSRKLAPAGVGQIAQLWKPLDTVESDDN